MTERVELWLARHGETTYSVDRVIAGWSDPPLTARGRRQAAALRPRLEDQRFESVWSSDLQRAVTTAELAWGSATRDHRLRELNFGRLEGRPFAEVDAEVAKVFFEFRDFTAPGGETRAAFAARIASLLDRLPVGRHLLFTHGGVIRLLTQDRGLDRFLPTGSLVGLDWRSGELLFVHEPDEGTPVFEDD